MCEPELREEQEMLARAIKQRDEARAALAKAREQLAALAALPHGSETAKAPAPISEKGSGLGDSESDFDRRNRLAGADIEGENQGVQAPYGDY